MEGNDKVVATQVSSNYTCAKRGWSRDERQQADSSPNFLVRVQVLLEEDLQLILVVGQLVGADGNEVNIAVAALSADLRQLGIRLVAVRRVGWVKRVVKACKRQHQSLKRAETALFHMVAGSRNAAGACSGTIRRRKAVMPLVAESQHHQNRMSIGTHLSASRPSQEITPRAASSSRLTGLFGSCLCGSR